MSEDVLMKTDSLVNVRYDGVTMRRIETESDRLCVVLEMKVDELRSYLDAMKLQLEEMADNYEKEIEVTAQQFIDKQEKQRFYEFSNEESWTYRNTFPRIFLNAFHVAAYSLLEAEACSLARRIGKKKGRDVQGPKGKQANYLSSARVFIDKLTGLDLSTLSLWGEIDDGRELRNMIVHSNGELTKAQDIELAKKHKVLNTESRIELLSVRSRIIDEVSITYEYCTLFLDTLKKFFGGVYEELKVRSCL